MQRAAQLGFEVPRTLITTDPEDVRSVCQEKGYYDKGNFAGAFKTEKNVRLFSLTSGREIPDKGVAK